jgi:hypothetical protein
LVWATNFTRGYPAAERADQEKRRKKRLFSTGRWGFRWGKDGLGDRAMGLHAWEEPDWQEEQKLEEIGNELPHEARLKKNPGMGLLPLSSL